MQTMTQSTAPTSRQDRTVSIRSEVYAKESPNRLLAPAPADKGNRSSSNVLEAHAILVGPLRCHRGGGDAGGSLHVVHIAHKRLRVKSERLAHESSNAVTGCC